MTAQVMQFNGDRIAQMTKIWHAELALKLSCSQNTASVFSGEPVPPVTGTGLIVSMNSQRFSLAAVSARRFEILVVEHVDAERR